MEFKASQMGGENIRNGDRSPDTSETVSLNTFQHFPAKEIMAAKPGLIVFIKRAVHQSLPTIACLCLNTILLAVVSSQRI